ncbi:unnamed protein product [Linum trigynum]|uniref:Uncharacterized protein n=1 Tax=Linum trigynum TaxID=586398 RepID=A0AAV2CSZ0_9ROSI
MGSLVVAFTLKITSSIISGEPSFINSLLKWSYDVANFSEDLYDSSEELQVSNYSNFLFTNQGYDVADGAVLHIFARLLDEKTTAIHNTGSLYS